MTIINLYDEIEESDLLRDAFGMVLLPTLKDAAAISFILLGEIMIITIISVSMPALLKTCDYANRHKDAGLDFKIYNLLSEEIDTDRMLVDIETADLLLTDLMGIGSKLHSLIVDAMKKCKGNRLAIGGMAPPLSRLGGYDASRFKMDREGEANLHLIEMYWKRAEERDVDFIFNLVLKKYCGCDWLPDAVAPEISTGVYIKDPSSNREYGSREEYLEDHPSDPRRGQVLLVFSGSNYPTSTTECVRILFHRLSEVVDVLPVAMNDYNIGYVPAFRVLVGNPDVIVNVLPFRFMAGPMGGDSVSAVSMLEEIGVPVLSPFFLSGTSKEEWTANNAGLGPMEFMLNIFLPELDGSLCTLPIGFGEIIEDHNALNMKEIVPVEDRIDRIVGKVRNLISLRNKLNPDKRVAIISYNYPPGEGNLFGGSFLDGAGSISAILGMLVDEGYYTRDVTPKELFGRFLDGGILNDGQWISPSEEMIRYGVTGHRPEDLLKVWGEPPGDVMVQNGRYLIPGIVEGNVFIGLQPPRTSDPSDNNKDYHDKHMPPHHQYLAMYEWLQNVFKADAVIHLGTHGTLEFLPGKESATSSTCYPDMIMNDSVHIYAYYAGNPAEAMIAKRRSHACLVSYMPPPFIRSGVYGELVELEDAISEYRESFIVDAGRSEMVLKSLQARAEAMRLPMDIDELENELAAIRNSLIPQGLHVFGEALDRGEAEDYAVNAMRFPHDKARSFDESTRDLTEEGRELLLREYCRSGRINGDFDSISVSEESLEFVRSLMHRSMESKELDGLRQALEGRYLGVKAGGDVMKDPSILPTGYNIIQFNPYHIPSMSAFERGVKASEDAIQRYHECTGSYPEGAALILWGLETSRTQGLTIGQICGYLGLRMKGNSGEFANRFEPKCIKELGRPRVDVTVTMCGFFRDMFPNLVTGLNDLFDMVGSLDETDEDNLFKRNTRANAIALSDAGYTGEELQELAGCRLFGPAEGKYGTSITDAVSNSTWKEESELGEMFGSNLRYAYTRSTHGHDAGSLLKINHTRIDIVSQVRDSADNELIDLDHFYEFVGGLSKAVEVARNGERATVFIIDSSGPVVAAQDVQRSIERGIRTRLLNPKWINGLLETDYHGAQKINDRFENVLGLASTVGEVGSGVFSDMFDCYIRDTDTADRIKNNNNWAYISMLNRMFEAKSRGYWRATDEEIDLLRERYLEAEEYAEIQSDREP